LHIGEVEIPCFVLEDGTRVISGRGMTTAIGMKGRGPGVVRIVNHQSLKPYLGEELEKALTKPLKFIGVGSRTSNPTSGYEATILQQLCDAILTANDAGVLTSEQGQRYAQCAYVLVRALARVGIIALVDEATGYQEIRAREELERLLEKYIRGELGKWAKTFPDEFYREMFRLRNWQYSPFSVKRPKVLGHITNDVVYARLAPGVLEELKRKEPTDDKGRRKHKLFQWLTEDVGHPRLREYLIGVIALMHASQKWDEFHRLLGRAYPRVNTNYEMPLDAGEKQ
jgi:hypothetical protein